MLNSLRELFVFAVAAHIEIHCLQNQAYERLSNDRASFSPSLKTMIVIGSFW